MTGVLPCQRIEALIAAGAIAAEAPVEAVQVQPASLDLRLGAVAYRVRASFLAGRGRRVADRLSEFEMHRIDLSGGAGSRGVLEVRCHEAPFVLEHGQVVGRLVYERMAEAPARLYGREIASNYQGQGLKLAKQFREA